MKNELYEKGDKIEIKGSVIPFESVTVQRYTLAVRINHWIAAGSMILLALSGLALYWPPLFFIKALFGDGQNLRALHPWFGVVMFISFFGLFFRMWRLNIPDRSDGEWALHIKDVMTNKEDDVPDVGKYNLGQKVIFWAMSVILLILIGTGFVIWQAYFADYFSIQLQRVALIAHSVTALLAIMTWLSHVYAVYWIKGSLGAMTRGKVSPGFAWRHHRRWYKALLQKFYKSTAKK